MNKTWEAFNSRYYGVNKETVIWLLARCAICLHDRPNKTRLPLEPIVVNKRLERVQVDLIDMRHQPDEQFKWICHFRDHYSKFSVLFPLKSKQAAEVAESVCYNYCAYENYANSKGYHIGFNLYHDCWDDADLTIRQRTRI